MIDLIINAKKPDPETGSFTEYLADFLLGYGIKLPDPTPQPGKPLTLEQLREMDGQPVWIVEYPDWGHWELSEDANDYIVDRNLNFYGMKHDDPDGRYGLHKLGWLAYSCPPARIDRGEWISVKERLPNEEDDVLILVREIEHYGRHHEKRNVYYWQYVGWRVDEKWATTYCHGFRYIDDENEKDPRCEHEVTHWMPLPEPPEEE